MRLLVDAHVLDQLSQGSKTYIKGLYTGVFNINHQDDFYVAANCETSVHSELGVHANVHPLQYSSHNKFVRLGWEMSRIIKAKKIDWAHYQYISPIQKSCSEIVTIHDLLFLDYPNYFPLNYRLIKNFLFKRSAKRAEWVLTVSEYSKQALVRHFGINPDQIIITPNGILDTFWKNEGNENDACARYGLKHYVLYVSRIEPRKNHAGLLKAYLDLQLWKQEIQLVFIGGVGIKASEFEQQYQALDEKVKGMIVFLNDLTVLDLKNLYKNCLLFVYPSFAEGFGIPPLEALACGANVISSNTTAMAEFQFLGNRLFNPGNVGEMRDKIDFFLKNPGENRLASQDYLKSHYSWDAGAIRLLNLLR